MLHPYLSNENLMTFKGLERPFILCFMKNCIIPYLLYVNLLKCKIYNASMIGNQSLAITTILNDNDSIFFALACSLVKIL